MNNIKRRSSKIVDVKFEMAAPPDQPKLMETYNGPI